MSCASVFQPSYISWSRGFLPFSEQRNSCAGKHPCADAVVSLTKDFAGTVFSLSRTRLRFSDGLHFYAGICWEMLTCSWGRWNVEKGKDFLFTILSVIRRAKKQILGHCTTCFLNPCSYCGSQPEAHLYLSLSTRALAGCYWLCSSGMESLSQLLQLRALLGAQHICTEPGPDVLQRKQLRVFF